MPVSRPAASYYPNVQINLLLPYYNVEFKKKIKIFCQKTDNFKTRKLILSKRQP